MGGSALVVGSSDCQSGAGNVDGVLAVHIEGQSTVFAESNPLGAATILGSGNLAPVPGFLVHGGSAVLTGVGAATASVGRIVLVTAQFYGTSQLFFHSTTDVSVSFPCSSAMLAAGAKTLVAWVRFFGYSSLVPILPLPFYGQSYLQVNPEVISVPLPLDTVVEAPRTFRVGQQLQQGDLAIYFRTGAGRVNPVWVSYTFFYEQRQLGPRRTPVKGFELGAYYVSDFAPTKPGNWVVRWEYQASLWEPIQSQEMSFLVQDAVAADDPQDTTVRVKKYGWI